MMIGNIWRAPRGDLSAPRQRARLAWHNAPSLRVLWQQQHLAIK